MLFLSIILLFSTNLFTAVSASLIEPLTEPGRDINAVNGAPRPEAAVQAAAAAVLANMSPEEIQVSLGNATFVPDASNQHHNNGTLAARTPTFGVYICSHANWKGPCTYIVASGGRCHNYPFGGPSHSAFGPDFNLQCDLFGDANCVGKKGYITGLGWPGQADLRPLIGNWGGVGTYHYGSFRCFICWGCKQVINSK